jgi:hypothetical protein
MGMNEDRDTPRERISPEEEDRLLGTWLGVSKRERRKIARDRIRAEKPGMIRWNRTHGLHGGWELWNPRNWDLLSLVVWVLIIVGSGWFWWLVIRRVLKG